MSRIHRSLALACVAVMVCAAAARAERRVSNFGTTDVQPAVISAWEMEPSGSGGTWAGTANGFRYITGGGVGLMGIVHVPQGALLTALDLEACDTAPTGEVAVTLYKSDSSGLTSLVSVQTGIDAQPGCGRFRTDLGTPEQVDNEAFTYRAFVTNITNAGAESIGAVRCYYKLQVSPAPPAATFNDVPTSDPGFQYVEALAASGITAGCGSGNYCPDAGLTRRQMAVFLAKALGLHWYAQTPPNLQH